MAETNEIRTATRSLATIRTIECIEKIETRDFIEHAIIGLWKCFIPVNKYKVGERVIYIEINSFVPAEIINNIPGLNPDKRDFNGMSGLTVKTIRYRKDLIESRGLILPLSILSGADTLEDGHCVTEQLNIIKRGNEEEEDQQEERQEEKEKDIKSKRVFKRKAHKHYDVKPAYILCTSLPRVQNQWSNILDDHLYEITEKIDGTAFTVFNETGEVKVCSRNYVLDVTSTSYEESKTPWYKWCLEQLKDKVPVGYGVQGELCGPGIQDNPLKLAEVQLYVYCVFEITHLETIVVSYEYLPYQIKAFCETHDIPTVPVMGTEKIESDADREFYFDLLNRDIRSSINPYIMAEGVVYKSTTQIGPCRRDIKFKVLNE